MKNLFGLKNYVEDTAFKDERNLSRLREKQTIPQLKT